MTKTQLFHLKHEMLGANFIANLAGVLIVNKLIMRPGSTLPDHIWENPVVDVIDSAFTPFAFTFVMVMTLLYERPIRRYLTAVFKQTEIPAELAQKARQNALNEPFVLIALDFMMWLLAAVVYPIMFWVLELGPIAIQRSLFSNLTTGLITVTVAFFLLEHVLQKRLAPRLFPDGGLSRISKTLRIRIPTRLVALFFACCLIPLVSIIYTMHLIISSSSDPVSALQHLRATLITNCLLFVGVGICLTMLVSRNLTIPFKEIIDTLRRIRKGRFEKTIRVTTNDEIGYTGDVINEMTEGLKERDRMRQSLNLAMEVQQNLMPNSDPKVDGLDIAGTSIYCEETGGDYYDFLVSSQNGHAKVSVIVGDVSDHGIPSALLMATARASLRQRAIMSGNLDQIVTDVNKQLCRDVEDSGRFMTLFFSDIERQKQRIRWVNAGHDAAIIYDPQSKAFEDLTGRNLPLGVLEDTAYQEFQRDIKPGQIILIGTDGIWESQNPDGRMFGKKRFKDIIRAHADAPAKKILETVINTLDEFRRPLAKTDDVTLVIIKVERK